MEWILDPFWNLRLDCIFKSLNFKKFGFLYLKFEIFVMFICNNLLLYFEHQSLELLRFNDSNLFY